MKKGIITSCLLLASTAFAIGNRLDKKSSDITPEQARKELDVVINVATKLEKNEFVSGDDKKEAQRVCENQDKYIVKYKADFPQAEPNTIRQYSDRKVEIGGQKASPINENFQIIDAAIKVACATVQGRGCTQDLEAVYKSQYYFFICNAGVIPGPTGELVRADASFARGKQPALLK